MDMVLKTAVLIPCASGSLWLISLKTQVKISCFDTDLDSVALTALARQYRTPFDASNAFCVEKCHCHFPL